LLATNAKRVRVEIMLNKDVDILNFTKSCEVDLGLATPVTGTFPAAAGLFWNATSGQTKREQGGESVNGKLRKVLYLRA